MIRATESTLPVFVSVAAWELNCRSTEWMVYKHCRVFDISSFFQVIFDTIRTSEYINKYFPLINRAKISFFSIGRSLLTFHTFFNCSIFMYYIIIHRKCRFLHSWALVYFWHMNRLFTNADRDHVPCSMQPHRWFYFQNEWHSFKIIDLNEHRFRTQR